MLLGCGGMLLWLEADKLPFEGGHSLIPQIGEVSLSLAKHRGVSAHHQWGALTTRSVMVVRASSISTFVSAEVLLWCSRRASLRSRSAWCRMVWKVKCMFVCARCTAQQGRLSARPLGVRFSLTCSFRNSLLVSLIMWWLPARLTFFWLPAAALQSIVRVCFLFNGRQL